MRDWRLARRLDGQWVRAMVGTGHRTTTRQTRAPRAPRLALCVAEMDMGICPAGGFLEGVPKIPAPILRMVRALPGNGALRTYSTYAA